ncbi:MAG: hypothetical protein Q8920_13875 [Bacillota bacterium]|nr:hypothetical protein [Bacillota bacterium]
MRTLEKIKLIVYFAVRVIILVAGIMSVIRTDWVYFKDCSTALLITFVPDFVKKKLYLKLSVFIEIVLVLYIFAAIFLGETLLFFDKFFWWDIMLHSVSGLIFGYIGYKFAWLLTRNGKTGKLSPLFIVIFTFCFSVTIGTLWEIYEFIMDRTFGYRMQDDLFDTMTDLIFDSSGSLLYSVAGFFWLKQKIRRKVRENKDQFYNEAANETSDT